MTHHMEFYVVQVITACLNLREQPDYAGSASIIFSPWLVDACGVCGLNVPNPEFTTVTAWAPCLLIPTCVIPTGIVARDGYEAVSPSSEFQLERERPFVKVAH